MKDLYIGLRAILKESMSVFTRDALTGRLSFSLLDSFFYFLLPLLLFIGTFFFDFPINKALNEAIVGVLTIFVVLSFQVVFIATDKFSSRIAQLREKKRNEEEKVQVFDDEKNYLKRIGNYSRQFVRQLILLILFSVLIIMCSLALIFIENHIVNVAISSIMLPAFYIWLLLLLKMIVSIYNLQMDDIKQNYSLLR